MKKIYALVVAVIASVAFAAVSVAPAAQAGRYTLCGYCDGGGPPDCNAYTLGYTYTSGSGTYRCTQTASGADEYVRIG